MRTQDGALLSRKPKYSLSTCPPSYLSTCPLSTHLLGEALRPDVLVLPAQVSIALLVTEQMHTYRVHTLENQWRNPQGMLTVAMLVLCATCAEP